jgi:hypothetical protein
VFRATNNPKRALDFAQGGGYWKLFLVLKLTTLTVPIFDGTKGNYDPAVISNMTLSQWHGSQQEIPPFSLVLVAYTASLYKSTYQPDILNLALNLQWVIMLEESIE